MKKFFLSFVFISIFFLFSFADEWQELYDTVRTYYFDGDYSKSEIKAKEHVDYTIKNFSPKSIELAHTYNNIGLAYEKLSDRKNAAEYYQKAYEIAKIIYDENDDTLKKYKENYDRVK